MATQGAYKRIDDGLILQFDPANIKCFRGEPTVNLKPYPILSHWINSGTCTNNITETDILPPFINNQLSIWSCVVNTTGSIHFGMQPTTILPSTTYTISIWYRQNRAGVSSPYIRTNVNNNSIGSFTYNGSSDSNSWPINTWIRITATATTPSNENGIYLSNYVGSQVGDKIWYYGYQIEQKDHVTAYTSTSRGTTVSTGGGLIDLSNNQNHGELINGVLYDSDNCGSLKFDGVDDSIAVPINNIPIGNSPRTIVIWFKYNKYETIYTAICGYGIQGTANTFDIIIGNNGFNTISLDVYGSGGISTYFDYTNTNWNQVVAIYTGTQLQLYLNDELKSYNNFNINTLSSNLIIGDNVWSYPGMYRGNISQILFYNRALSQSEITQIYNSTKSRYL